MIAGHVRAAMRNAGYELLEDGSFYGEIGGSQGVYANAETLEACRRGASGGAGGLDRCWCVTGAHTSCPGGN